MLRVCEAKIICYPTSESKSIKNLISGVNSEMVIHQYMEKVDPVSQKQVKIFLIQSVDIPFCLCRLQRSLHSLLSPFV